MSFLVRLPENQYPPDALDGFAPENLSIATARAAAWLSQLAYEDEAEKIDRVLETWRLRRALSFTHPVSTRLPLVSTRGFIAEGRGALVIAFEGTDPLVLANWVTNFSFLPDTGGIHQGFSAALAAGWRDISSMLTGRTPRSSLFIVGHSLGGALAVLCARRIKRDKGIAAAGVYTFGMPRAGNASFAREYNKAFGDRTYRFVHGEDVVPTVPPSELGFRHVGRMIRCARHAKFDPELPMEASDDPPFAPSLINGVKSGLLQLLAGSLPPEIRPDPLGRASRLLPPGIADHLPDRYWHALQ